MKRILALLLLCVLLLTGCSKSNVKAEKTMFAMDTVMSLSLWGRNSEKALEEGSALLLELEETYSVLNPDSVVNQENPSDPLLDRVSELSARTDGAFNPMLRQLSMAWGFYGDDKHVPDTNIIISALLNPQWDLGGALKGHAGDELVALSQKLHLDRAIFNLGGNVQTYGSKPDNAPWQIGIENPDGGSPLGVVSFTGTKSVVSSGDYQRYFEENGIRYHHILDPQTGYPADSGLRMVTILSDSGLMADCYSTALFVMGLEKGSDFWRKEQNFEAVFVCSDGSIYATEGVLLSGCDYQVIAREK